MPHDNWVRSLGLDTDGSLFVETDNGIRLYDLCLNVPLPAVMSIHPEELMKPENRHLYYRFLATLKEMESIMFLTTYDGGHQYEKGDVVVDAGARIGVFAAKISASVGNEGKVIAIEPEPRSFACLQKNIKANNLINVVPVQKMLWSKTEHRKLYLSGNAAAHSAYLNAFYSSTGEFISVEADTLDNILEELGIESVDFIKMDIEGSEIEALKGMSKILESDLQLAISAYHPAGDTLTHAVIIPQLEQLGFKTVLADGIVQAKRGRE
jgi:FkbM family methyltransferase